MKLYYICSPYRGTPDDILKHTLYAKELTREILLQGNCAVTPHLYMTDCLNDDRTEERKIGMKATRELVMRCDLLVVGAKYGISEGMAAEIKLAKLMMIPIIYLDRERKEPLEEELRCDGWQKRSNLKKK